MRKLILILLFPVLAYGAGSETIDPDGNIRIGTDWAISGECTQEWDCVSDNSDADYVQHYDNNNITDMLFRCAGMTERDSTIDSVNYICRWQTGNVGNTWQLTDSISGQTAGLRNSATISSGTTGSWLQDTVKYTLTPDGNAYTASDIDELAIGFYLVAKANNKYIMCNELWTEVWYSGEAPATNPQVIMIMGGD